MNALNLWEFDHYLDEAEVWAGRKTDVHCVNDHNVILFETTTPWVREKTGFEPTIHLDSYRRDELGKILNEMAVIPQMIIVSHEDSFESSTDNVYKIKKVDGISKVKLES